MYVYSDVNLYIGVYSNDELTFDEYSINQSIMTILGTVPGQRLFRPAFGSNIYELLFEPMNQDTAAAIKNAIINAIAAWEPRIVLANSLVYPDYPNQAYYVNLEYTIPTLTNRAASFAFNLSKLPS